MTETNQRRKFWESATRPAALYMAPNAVATQRQTRLVGCAIIRSHKADIACLGCRLAVEVAERYADGLLGLGALYAAKDGRAHENHLPNAQMTCALSRRVTEGSCPIGLIHETASIGFTNDEDESQLQCALLRDIFGNAHYPTAFAAEWRTDTVTTLAQHTYESRDFSAMPILADAVQDAGCASEDVLSHCRDPQQVHVRGCGIVDLVLGKS